MEKAIDSAIAAANNDGSSLTFSQAFGDLDPAPQQNAFAKKKEKTSAATTGRDFDPSKNRSLKITSTHLICALRQQGNRVMDHVKNVPFMYMDVKGPDFVFGKVNNPNDLGDMTIYGCALFLSLKYHALNPYYIGDRVKNLNKQPQYCNNYADSTTSRTKTTPRILLVLVDEDKRNNYASPVAKLSTYCMKPNVNMTLIVAFSEVEAARYLEGFKKWETKAPDVISGMGADWERKNFSEKFEGVLTVVKGVNKSDSGVLGDSFKSFRGIANAR